jgi:RNA polymerase sigma-70 factor, ECF subfamily
MDATPDDDTLLEHWRAGDNRAGNALFERHFRGLLRFFRNKIATGVEDLVQETLLACVRGRDRLRDDRSFRAYLFATARFQLYEHIRRTAKQPVDLETHSVEDVAPGLSSMYAKKHEQRLLLDALRRLPIELQVTLELYYWEGLSGPELAAALDLSEPAVRGRIRRGAARLREEIERLAANPELMASTCGDLDGWLAQLREVCGRRSDTAPGT